MLFCIMVSLTFACPEYNLANSGTYELCFDSSKMRKVSAYLLKDECHASILQYIDKSNAPQFQIPWNEAPEAPVAVRVPHHKDSI